MEKWIKYSGKIAFALLLLLVVVMGVATFVEREKGSAFVYEHIYYGFPFKLLWLLTAAFGAIYLVVKDFYHHRPAFLLHCSFIVILLGALVTHLTSISGYVHLRENEPQSLLVLSEKKGMMQLPFTLRLDRFDIIYYKGTDQPSNYRSCVTIDDRHAQVSREEVISMNNILSYKGYRFYQSSFDQDKKGSILSVNRDVYGIPITYAGYLLLLVSCVWVLFDSRGRFRQILQSPLLKKMWVWLFLMLLPLPTLATPPTVDRTHADRLEQLWIHYNGRIAPLQTFARDFTLKLTGKTDYKDYSAMQVLAGFLFYPQEWLKEPVIAIENDRLKQMLQTTEEHVSYERFFKKDDTYLLDAYINQPGLEKEESSFQKAVQKAHDQVQLIFMLQTGYYMELYPVKNGEVVKWYGALDELPEGVEERQESLIRNALNMYGLCVSRGEPDLALQFLDRIVEYQKKVGGDTLPSERVKQAELFYNRLSPFTKLFMVDLTCGMLILILFIFFTVKEKKSKRFVRFTQIVLGVLFIAHTLALGLRSYISGRIPMSNGYETMLIVSWSALFISLCTGYRRVLLAGLGILLSGFTLLVAHLAMLNPQITPLVPVLTSPLLTIHVAVLMMAYALAGFIALDALVAFSLLLFSRAKNKEQSREQVKQLRLLSELFLYPCTFLLGIGIFIGAVWANVSWGRYWGWDPKEVWALISFMLYALAFHRTTIPYFRNDFFFHLYSLVAFASILMTYFGVNFFLGGMHSYAGNSDLSGFSLWTSIVLLVLSGMLVAAYKKVEIVPVERKGLNIQSKDNVIFENCNL